MIGMPRHVAAPARTFAALATLSGVRVPARPPACEGSLAEVCFANWHRYRARLVPRLGPRRGLVARGGWFLLGAGACAGAAGAPWRCVGGWGRCFGGGGGALRGRAGGGGRIPDGSWTT